MKFKNKILIFSILSIVLSIAVTGFIAFNISQEAQEGAAYQNLNSLKMAKKDQIEDYFATINKQIITMSNDFDAPLPDDILKGFES